MRTGRFALLLLCFIAMATGLGAQEKFKFGTVPQKDLELKVYDKDTSAAAVILYKECEITYSLVNNDFRLSTWNVIRIKILKATGTSHANFELPYYQGSNNSNSDAITGIAGFTHNLTDGTVEKIKLGKEHIMDEKTSEDYYTKKITFPNVKEGSVIELRYTHLSPHYTYIEDYVFQDEIPVVYNKYKVTIPDYFRFSKHQFGYEPLKYTEGSENVVFNLRGGGSHRAVAKSMTFEGFDLPALKDDSYVWNKNDFTTRVYLDLSGIQYPGVAYKSFSTTWTNIDEQLMKYEKFGRQLSSNLLKDEMQAVLKDGMKPEQKMEAILAFVKSKMKWNNKNTLYVDNLRNAVKQGVGSSAEMNALLVSLLRNAGFDANPVVMSLRSRGRLITSYPSQKKLNYFLAAVENGDKTYYLDASYKYAAVNSLHIDCMVQNARLITPKGSKWVDLEKTGSAVRMSNFLAGFNEEGQLSGNIQVQRKGVSKNIVLGEIDDAKTDAEYVKEVEAEIEMEVSDHAISGKEPGATLKESFKFKNPAVNLDEDFVYVNPLIIAQFKENPFKAETRKLPVEYPYPYDNINTVVLQIPENYTIEELPQAEKLVFDENGSLSYSYLIQRNGNNNVQIQQRITLNRTIYTPNEYEFLRDFWNRIVSKNNEMIVLKKISE